MKVIRGRCEREIDFTRQIKYYGDSDGGLRGFSIPVLDTNDNPPIMCFWEDDTIRATVGNDVYELDKNNLKAYAQLKNNVEILFALHSLK